MTRSEAADVLDNLLVGAPDDSSLDAQSLIHIGPPVGQTCQCGLMPWTAEDRQRGWQKAHEARS